jgi:GntR family transcriptional regulator / MocR family aminotransferase
LSLTSAGALSQYPVGRMRKLYLERRDCFIEQFNKLLGDRFLLQIPEAGLHLVAWLRHEADFARVARARAETGVKPPSLAFFCIRAKLKPAFVFGFAAWTPAQIREGLVRLASALR